MNIKPLLVIGASLLGAYLFTYNGCDNRFAGAIDLRVLKIDTWDEWKAYLFDPSGGFQIYTGTRKVSFDTDSIRADFVRAFYEDFIKEYEKEPLAEALSEKELQELDRLKMLGVWAEGTHMHISYEMWPILEPEEEFFQKLVISWKRYLNAKREELTRDTYPESATIRSLFSKLDLHGPGNQEATIELPFTFEMYKGKPNQPEL